MARSNTVTISVIANTARARQGLNGVEGSLGKLGGIARTAGAAVAAGLAIAATAAAGLAVASIKAASDAEQSLGATETVFGKYADGVIKNSKRAATAIGISANEYRELSNVTGALLSCAGMPLKKVAGLTDDLNKRAADMAATFGGTTKEAVEAISSLMKGEADPIEKYGVSIKQSDVNARLAAQGLDKLTGEAKKQAEMQARLDLLMKKTSKTQGAFKRETNTLAHQQQVLGAQFENLKAKIGAVFLPVLTKVFGFISKNFEPALAKLKPVLDQAKAAFDSIKDALKPVGDWFKDHPEVIKGIGIALGVAAVAAGAFAIAMGAVAVATSPITLTVLAIAAVGGAIAYAYKNSETFRNAVAAIGQALKNFASAALPIVQQVGDALREKWADIAPVVMQAFQSIKEIVVNVMGIISTVISTSVNVMQGLWQRFGGNILSFVTATFGNIANFIGGVLQAISGVVKVVLSVIRGDWKGAWNGIKQIVSGVWQAIKAVISQVLNVIKFAISNAWAAIKGLTSAAWNGIKSAVSAGITGVMNLIRGLPGKAKSALGNLGGLLKGAGEALLNGLKDGIEAGWEKVKGVLKNITDKIPDWKGPKNKDKKLLRQTGIWIMESLVDGFKEGSKGVQASLKAITQKIQKFKGHKKAIKDTTDERKGLLRLAATYDKVKTRLNEVTKSLEEQKKARDDFKNAVTDSIKSYGSVLNLNAGFSADAMVKQMQARIDKAKQFADVLKSLRAQGLNDTMFAELAKAGVEGGLASALAIQQGGKEAIDQFNKLQKELDGVATGLGNSTSGSLYDVGINAAQGLVNGLTAQTKKLEKAAKNLAMAMVKAIKKALGIKSPSREFAKLGAYTVQGLQVGLKDTRGVEKATVNLADAMERSFNPPTLKAIAKDSSTSNAAPITLNLNGTFVGTTKEQVGKWFTEAQDEYLKTGARRAA